MKPDDVVLVHVGIINHAVPLLVRGTIKRVEGDFAIVDCDDGKRRQAHHINLLSVVYDAEEESQ